MGNKNTETAPRRRGRPASFPDQEVVAFLATIPVEVRDMVREVAAKREENINVTLARMIERGHRDAMRSRSRGKASA